MSFSVDDSGLQEVKDRVSVFTHGIPLKTGGLRNLCIIIKKNEMTAILNTVKGDIVEEGTIETLINQLLDK